MTSPEEFIYDNRTLLTHLQNFQTYTGAIPFNDLKNWDEVFFNDGQTPQSLAALLEQAASAPGTLQPQQAFLLAFLKMMETPRRLMNTLPARHRELYFRGVLGVKPLPAVADQVMLQFTPDELHQTLNLPEGLLFSAGQDSAGAPVNYRLDAPLLINHARITDIRWLLPDADTKAVRACTLLDLAAGITPPAGGVRLFSPQVGGKPGVPQDETVRYGWLLVIPTLKAAGTGQRKLTLTFGASPEGLKAEVSIGTQWQQLECTTNESTLTATLEASLNPEAPAEYALLADPVIRLYQETSTPTLPNVTAVEITVVSASDVTVTTAEGVTAPVKQVSYLFGHAPKAGSSFTLSSPAWRNASGQTLTLTLTPKWQGRPADLKAWYINYPNNAVSDNGVFTIKSEDLVQKEASLFGEGQSDNPLIFSRTLKEGDNTLVVNLGAIDFQHALYDKTFKEGKITEDKLLNPPYDPRLEDIDVSYSLAGVAFTPYALLPYGYAQTSVGIGSPHVYLGLTDIHPGQQLSLYWSLDTPVPFASDGLVWEYLSQTNAVAQWKALSKQLSDNTGNFARNGSGAVTLPVDAANKTTLMPTGRYWLRVSKFALTDHQVQLPVYMTQDLSATEQQKLLAMQPDVEPYPWLNGLWANAQSATLVDAATIAPEHFATPLPAGTVRSTVVPFNGLSAVLQPLPGWGGEAQESDAASMQRIAEQVMHRGRASNWRDIVQLVIANFPDVHHVRLPGTKILDGLYIPKAPSDSSRTSATAEPVLDPDRVQEIMVIPQAGINQGKDPRKPILSPARLKAIQQFITDRASPWLNLRVLNPCYLEVEVEYDVAVDASVNPANLHSQLDEKLRQHFMPWLNGQQRVQPGDTLTINDIMQVLQQHPAVRYVTDVTLNGKYDAIETTLAVIVLKLSSDASLLFTQPEETA
ncbi:hypothetical protein [Pantoea sp. A4]|uniref:hypothetical protein n=1 Tax=Pantoea sp. A4 TaxID=1225184 RepID=UPI000372CD47|nr:hypothetical protein [Pantoea sp. A4]